MGKSRLKIKIISSKKAEKNVKEVLYDNIAKQIFESPDFQKMLEKNNRNYWK